MKILIRKFSGIWERDRAPHAFPAPDPNGRRERRHPFRVNRPDSRHVVVERFAPSVLSWLKPRPAKRGDTGIAAVRRESRPALTPFALGWCGGNESPPHPSPQCCAVAPLCAAQVHSKKVGCAAAHYRTVVRIASGVDAVRACLGAAMRNHRRTARARHCRRGSAPLVFRASGTHHALPKTDQRAAARLPHRRANRIRCRCRSRPVWHLRCGFCRG